MNIKHYFSLAVQVGLFLLLLLAFPPSLSQAAWYYFQAQNTTGQVADDFTFSTFSDRVSKAKSNSFTTATITKGGPTTGDSVALTVPVVPKGVAKNVWITFGYKTGLISTGVLSGAGTFWTKSGANIGAASTSSVKELSFQNPNGTMTINVVNTSSDPVAYLSFEFWTGIPVSYLDATGDLMTGVDDFLSPTLDSASLLRVDGSGMSSPGDTIMSITY